MRKLIATILILSLVITTPVFAETAPNADLNRNVITAPDKIKPKSNFTFTAQGDRQSSIGAEDGESRYIPYLYRITGPNSYYYSEYYSNASYSKSINLIAPGTYTITTEFIKQSYDHGTATWNDVGPTDVKFKQVIVNRPKFKIKLNANKGKFGSKKTISKKVSYYKKYGKFKKPKRANYKFKGWYTKKKGGKRITKSTQVTKLKAHTLYAHWEKKSKPKASSAKKSTASKNSNTSSSSYVYITSTGTKYHSNGCRYLSSSKIKIALKKAKSQGFTACSVCL